MNSMGNKKMGNSAHTAKYHKAANTQYEVDDRHSFLTTSLVSK